MARIEAWKRYNDRCNDGFQGPFLSALQTWRRFGRTAAGVSDSGHVLASAGESVTG